MQRYIEPCKATSLHASKFLAESLKDFGSPTKDHQSQQAQGHHPARGAVPAHRYGAHGGRTWRFRLNLFTWSQKSMHGSLTARCPAGNSHSPWKCMVGILQYYQYFRCHVSFREGTFFQTWLHLKFLELKVTPKLPKLRSPIGIIEGLPKQNDCASTGILGPSRLGVYGLLLWIDGPVKFTYCLVI